MELEGLLKGIGSKKCLGKMRNLLFGEGDELE